MKKINFSKKMIIIVSSILAGAAVLASGIALGVNRLTNHNKSNNMTTNPSQPISYNSNIMTNNLGVRLIQQEQTNQYEITIINNNDLGKIQFYNQPNTTSIIVDEGQKVNIEVIMNNDQVTVRDLKIYGENKNISLASRKLDIANKNIFEFTTPIVSEYEEGLNPFLSNNISIEATYIKKQIANNIEWNYGALFGDINAYNAYTLSNNTSWSQIAQQKGWDLLFNVDARNSTDPVSIVIFLNGYELMIDENIYVPAGYNLTFINNSNDTLVNNKKGKLVAKNSKTGALIINAWTNSLNQVVSGGNITIYNSIEARTAQSGSGIGILNEDTDLTDFINYARQF